VIDRDVVLDLRYEHVSVVDWHINHVDPVSTVNVVHSEVADLPTFL
jgi:hypothetical protein